MTEEARMKARTRDAASSVPTAKASRHYDIPLSPKL